MLASSATCYARQRNSRSPRAIAKWLGLLHAHELSVVAALGFAAAAGLPVAGAHWLPVLAEDAEAPAGSIVDAGAKLARPVARCAVADALDTRPLFNGRGAAHAVAEGVRIGGR